MWSPQTAARIVKALALVEAFTWAGLLFGMFLKYVTKTTELGVHIFGPLHGTVFGLYVMAVAVAIQPLRWSARVAAIALLSAVPPLGTLVFERFAQRSGHFGAPVR